MIGAAFSGTMLTVKGFRVPGRCCFHMCSAALFLHFVQNRFFWNPQWSLAKLLRGQARAGQNYEAINSVAILLCSPIVAILLCSFPGHYVLFPAPLHTHPRNYDTRRGDLIQR